MVQVFEVTYKLEGQVKIKSLKWLEAEKLIRKILGVSKDQYGKDSIKIDLGTHYKMYLEVTRVTAGYDGFVIFLSALKEDIDYFEEKKGCKFEEFLKNLEKRLVQDLEKMDELNYMYNLLNEVKGECDWKPSERF